MDPLTPNSHGEEVAVFRHGLIGAITLRSLTHGERIALLRDISQQRVRPPGRDTARGGCRRPLAQLGEEVATAPLVGPRLRHEHTLCADGRIGPTVTTCTVRRMFCEKGLPRWRGPFKEWPRSSPMRSTPR